jgi:multimeric flavodoxin WrbA
MSLNAFALNCSLKSSKESSSTDKLLDEVLFALKEHDVTSSGTVRVADSNVLPGVTSDEGPGDDWPKIRQQILDADIFVLGTPIWMGHPSSNAQRVLERLDAFLGEKDDREQMVSVDKVALVAVVGNEDGAHHVSAELFQGLNDVGFTIPANGLTYWVGEAMHTTDYRDLPGGSEKTHSATKLAAAQAAHLARVLAENPYPKI